MSISQNTFTDNRIKSPFNSWAIWDQNFPKSPCVCDGPGRIIGWMNEGITRLTPKVIFLALNPTVILTNNYESFHFPLSRAPNSRDVKLKNLLDGLTKRVGAKNNQLSGGFMTDLDSIKAPTKGNL